MITLKILGINLLVALSLMTCMATDSKAVTWDVNGKEITGTVTFSGTLGAGETTLLLVPAQNLVIHCTGITTTEGTLRTDNTAHWNLQHTGCSTKVKGVESPGCKPVFLDLKVKDLPILHNGKIYLLIEPLTGTSLGMIHYNEETCALPPLPTISGEIIYECLSLIFFLPLSCSHSLPIHPMRPADPALFPSAKLLYGLNPATLHGRVDLSLTGANSGQNFGGLI